MSYGWVGPRRPSWRAFAGWSLLLLGAATAFAACAGTGGENVTSGGETSAGTGASSTTSTHGDGGNDIGFEANDTCGADPSALFGACEQPSTFACVYASECAPFGCHVRCIGSVWTHICKPCTTPAVACPTTPPAHGDPCTNAVNDGNPCHYDDCAAKEDFAIATCVGGVFEVDHTLCNPPGCKLAANPYEPCPASRVCVDMPACEPWPAVECPDNPCAHEPLSCACAGSLCPSGTICKGTQAGHVLCGPPAGPNDPERIVTGLDEVEDFDIDGTSIYLAAETQGTLPHWALRRAPIGGGPTTVLAPTAHRATLAVTPSAIFFADIQAEKINRLPLPSGAASVIASGEHVASQPAANATHLFWKGSMKGEDVIRQVPLAGGTAATLVTAPLLTIRSFVVDDQTLYWAHTDGETLTRQPLSGGAGTVLASGTFLFGLAMDGSHVYFGDRTAGTISRVPSMGGAVETIASALSLPGHLAVDATHVYWGDSLDASVSRAPKAGGPVEVLATHQSPTRLRLDATYVYWSATSSAAAPSCGSVFRMLK